MALAFLLGFSASAATVPSTSDTGPTAAPAAAIDVNLLNSFVSGRPLVLADKNTTVGGESCQRGGEPCDDQHKCCHGLQCHKGLFDRRAVCDSTAS